MKQLLLVPIVLMLVGCGPPTWYKEYFLEKCMENAENNEKLPAYDINTIEKYTKASKLYFDEVYGDK